MLDSRRDPGRLRDWILDWLAKELKIARTEINPQENLLKYGIDSVIAIMFVGDLEDQLGLRLSPTLVWDFPTVDKIVDELLIESGAEPSKELKSATTSNDVARFDELDTQQAQELLDKLDQLTDAEVEALLNRLSRT
jgi:acyl carrier protein